MSYPTVVVRNPLKKIVLLLIILTMIYICGTTAEQCRSGPVNVVGFYTKLGYLHYNDTNKLIYTDGSTEHAFYTITIDAKGRFILIHEASETFVCYNKRRRAFKNIKRVSPRALDGCILDSISRKAPIEIGYNIMQNKDPTNFLQVRENRRTSGRYLPKLIKSCHRKNDSNKVAHGKCKFIKLFLKQYLEVESCIDEQINACRILKQNKFPKKFGFCNEYDDY